MASPLIAAPIVGARREALTQADLVEWVRGNVQIIAAAGVLALGTAGCVASFTGIGAVSCGAAIAYIASSMLPAQAGEPDFEALPMPDEPGSVSAYREMVDPTYECPAGYALCGEDYCSNLQSERTLPGSPGGRSRPGRDRAGKIGKARTGSARRKEGPDRVGTK